MDVKYGSWEGYLMERMAELLLAISICLFLVILSCVGFVYLGMDKKIVRATVCVQQMESQLDLWVSFVIDMTKTVRCDEVIACRLNNLADDYSKLKKSKDLLKKIPYINEMSEQLLLIEDYCPFGNTLGLTAEAVKRIQVLGMEYNRCINELDRRLNKRAAALIGKLFRVSRLEKLNNYFETIYN
jgi:hypothetical protein